MKKQTKLGLVLAAAAVLSVSVASLVSAKGWVQQGADWYYVDGNGEYVTSKIQTSGTAKFYLGEDGQMMRDYFLEEDDNGNTYYFGSNGAMVTNTWVAIEASQVENQGDFVPDNYWYYFQASGKAMKGSNNSPKKATIDGKKYLFNANGQMATGWIQSNGETVNPDEEENPFKDALYYAGGENDGVLRAGWVTYYDGYAGDDGWLGDKTNIYFYFNTQNNKKVGNNDDGAVTKKINGKTYAFTSEGIMMSGWNVVDETSDSPASLQGKQVYFSGEDDGHQVKKGWVYAVPAQSIDNKSYTESEEKYMYFSASGDIVKDEFKKINGKFYVFNPKGIMKTGLVLWCTNGTTLAGQDNAKYIDKIDTDWANGADVVKRGWLQTGDGKDDWIKLDPEGKVVAVGAGVKAAVGDEIKIHYFGSDGARRTGTNAVEFSDDTYSFYSTAGGDKGSGSISKKYYALGFLLKANADIRYAIYNTATFDSVTSTGTPFTAQVKDFYKNLENNKYMVLTTGGGYVKGAKTAKKDSDGNYWMIDKDAGHALKGIWTVNVKWAVDKVAQTKAVSNTQKLAIKATGKSTFSTADLAGYGVMMDQSKFLASDPIIQTSVVWEFDEDTRRFETQDIIENTYWFVGDQADKSNVNIPFGIYDNANKTCYIGNHDQLDKDATAYEVKMNDDYFANCFWNMDKENNNKSNQINP